MDIEERIRKLLRIAARDDGDQGRAAAAKARALMEKYKIVVDLHPSEAQEYETRRLIVPRNESLWWRVLLPNIAMPHGCNSYFMPHLNDAMLILTGPSTRIERLLQDMTEHCRRFNILGGHRSGPAFRAGCATAISEHLWKARVKLSRHHHRPHALVPIRRYAPGDPVDAMGNARSEQAPPEPTDWEEPQLNEHLMAHAYHAARRNILGIWW